MKPIQLVMLLFIVFLTAGLGVAGVDWIAALLLAIAAMIALIIICNEIALLKIPRAESTCLEPGSEAKR